MRLFLVLFFFFFADFSQGYISKEYLFRSPNSSMIVKVDVDKHGLIRDNTKKFLISQCGLYLTDGIPKSYSKCADSYYQCYSNNYLAFSNVYFYDIDQDICRIEKQRPDLMNCVGNVVKQTLCYGMTVQTFLTIIILGIVFLGASVVMAFRFYYYKKRQSNRIINI